MTRLQRAGQAYDQPLGLGGGDAVGEPHVGHVLGQRAGALAHRVEHHAVRADPGRERDGVEFGHGVGEQDENDAKLAGVARQPLEPAFRIGAGEDAELDVIDAERGGLAYGGANAVACRADDRRWWR